uniref:Uncharacterized protein n=1 Tax=Panagrolaimus sp. ES5 TaxID=591445 RepID=A0AC34FE90_9BILA
MSAKRVALFAKDHCLLSKNNYQGTFGKQAAGICNDQYNSINLNQHHKCEDLKYLHSKSIQSSSKNSVYTDTTGFVDFNESSAKSVASQTGKNNNDFSKSFGNLNIQEKEEQKYKGQNKDDEKCNNSSTLSLHISAYENANETLNVNDKLNKTESKQNTFASNTLKKVKSIFAKSVQTSQNPFVLLQKQNEESMQAEVMQFKASQKLMNFNSGVQKRKLLITQHFLNRIVSYSTDLSQQQEQPKYHDIENVPQPRITSHLSQLRKGTGGRASLNFPA